LKGRGKIIGKQKNKLRKLKNRKKDPSPAKFVRKREGKKKKSPSKREVDRSQRGNQPNAKKRCRKGKKSENKNRGD